MKIQLKKHSSSPLLLLFQRNSRIFLFLIGAVLGICFYEYVVIPSQNIGCFEGSYWSSLQQVRYLALLWNQEYLASNHNDVTILPSLKTLTSSGLMFTDFPNNKSNSNNSSNTTNASVVVAMAVAADNDKSNDKKAILLNSYYAGCGKNCHPIIRPLRAAGWIKVDEISQGRLVLSDGYKNDWFKQDSPVLQSWQRSNHIFNSTTWSRKDKLIAGIQRYHQQQQNNNNNQRQLYFVPDSYRLHEKPDLLRFHQKLKGNREWQYAWWIMTTGKNKERTMEIVKGNKIIPMLVKDKRENRKRYLEPYLCDQLRWKKGQNIIVRTFWLVASLDPLLVFYHDGYVRTGYNEKYYYHLHLDTNEATFSEFSEYLERNKPRVHYYKKKDPLQHIRNQIKESTALFVDAFKDTTFKKFVPTTPLPPSLTNSSNSSSTMAASMEDSFELYAFDFVLDKNLDVHLHTAWSDTAPSGEFRPFMNEDYYFLLQRKHEVYYSMILLLDDLWKRQASGDKL